MEVLQWSTTVVLISTGIENFSFGVVALQSFMPRRVINFTIDVGLSGDQNRRLTLSLSPHALVYEIARAIRRKYEPEFDGKLIKIVSGIECLAVQRTIALANIQDGDALTAVIESNYTVAVRGDDIEHYSCDCGQCVQICFARNFDFNTQNMYSFALPTGRITYVRDFFEDCRLISDKWYIDHKTGRMHCHLLRVLLKLVDSEVLWSCHTCGRLAICRSDSCRPVNDGVCWHISNKRYVYCGSCQNQLKWRLNDISAKKVDWRSCAYCNPNWIGWYCWQCCRTI